MSATSPCARGIASPRYSSTSGTPSSSWTSTHAPLDRSRPSGPTSCGPWFTVAPPAVREKMKLASEAAILCPSSVGQFSISMYLEQFDWKQQIVDFRAMYQERRDAMVAALEEFLPMCHWNVPDGGFYVWVGLPEGLDAKDMLPRAVTNLVAYVSGTAFYAGGRAGQDHLRLSFCYPEPAEIREGVRRLSGVVTRDLELLSLFGPTHSPHPSEGVHAPAPDQI